MNDQLNRLQLEEFIEKNLLDIQYKLRDILSVVIVQLNCSKNRKKRIEKEIELYERIMQHEELTFDNLTPLKSIKEKHHGTRTA